MVLYGFTLEMSLREGHGHRQASVVAYFVSQNRQLGLLAPVYPAPWRHSGVKQVAAHCQPCSLLHLGNRVYAAFSNTAGQILDSLEVRIKKPLKDVAFPSVSVSMALLTSASVVSDSSFEVRPGFCFISVHKQRSPFIKKKKKNCKLAAFPLVFSKCVGLTNAALHAVVL